MDRDTKSLTAGEHSFVVKAYATAREASAIQQAYFKGSKLEVVGDQPKISEFNPGVQFEVQQEMIRQMVVSFDDTADRIVERCIDLPSDVFDDIIAQLDELIAKKKRLPAQ